MNTLPPEARRLRLKAEFDAESAVLISVKDTGVGIPEADQERILDPLFTTKTGGMGLGLAICYTVIEPWRQIAAGDIEL